MSGEEQGGRSGKPNCRGVKKFDPATSLRLCALGGAKRAAAVVDAGGIIRIEVVEGHIDSITVEGADAQKRKILAIAAPLLKTGPLDGRQLERVIGLIRDLPGLNVSDVRISRSTSDPANHHLTLVVAQARFKGLAYVDNRGTERAGRERFYVTTTANSLITAGDEVRVAMFAIPGHGYHYLYGQAAATVPIGSDGLRFGVSASLGDQFQKYAIGTLTGQSVDLAAQLTYPLVRSRAFTAIAKLSLNDNRNIDDLRKARIQRDHIRVARVGLDINSTGKGRVDAHVAFAQGLAFDGVTRTGDRLASRPDGSGVFSKANATVQIAWPLSKKLTVRANLAAQYSTGPLLSAEEFSLGGSAIGRGYDFNTVLGDHGAGGGAEIGYYFGDLKSGNKQIELFAFADGGATFQSGYRSGFPRSETLSSVGVGSRFGITGIAVSAEVGVPLQQVETDKPVRAFVSMAKAF